MRSVLLADSYQFTRNYQAKLTYTTCYVLAFLLLKYNIMKYKELNQQAKDNAIVNYCYIMGISVDVYKKRVIDWFIKYEVNTLDCNGRFIYAAKNITDEIRICNNCNGFTYP